MESSYDLSSFHQKRNALLDGRKVAPERGACRRTQGSIAWSLSRPLRSTNVEAEFAETVSPPMMWAYW